MSTYLYLLFDFMIRSCHVRVLEWMGASEFATDLSNNFANIKWMQLDLNPQPLISWTNTQPFS